MKIRHNITMAKLWLHPKNKTYYAVWQEGQKRRRKVLKYPGTNNSIKEKDSKIAKKAFNHFQREMMAGKVLPISEGIKLSFYKYADEFLEHVKANLEDSTFVLYNNALKKAKKCWGDIPLNHISVRHIDKLVVSMLHDNLKTPTINKNFRHVKAALNKAYEWEYIKKPIRFPKQIKEKERVRYTS
ncbi:MAG: hypothetical protein GY714_23225 [Desulfobacterales bacterium]|nr:hypothetical protein [Desulfobacterales bacterium]